MGVGEDFGKVAKLDKRRASSALVASALIQRAALEEFRGAAISLYNQQKEAEPAA